MTENKIDKQEKNKEDIDYSYDSIYIKYPNDMTRNLLEQNECLCENCYYIFCCLFLFY